MGLRRLIREASTARVLVIGDMALDYYRVMSPRKLSPEAPVVIFSQDSTEIRFGCAANVANNLHALGCEVTMMSCVGMDWWSDYDDEVKFPFSTELIPCQRQTTVKERIITRKQQVIRIDTQTEGPVSNDEARSAVDKALEIVDDFDVVLFSDYDHGALTPEITNPVISKCLSNKKPVVVDSKALDSFKKYQKASIMLPNDAESRVMTGMATEPIEEVAMCMKNGLSLRAIGVTLGPDGILLIEGRIKKRLLPYGDDEVVDITGAGDTVAAAVALGLALGAPMEDAARLANIMGGIVVMKRGVATVGPREVEDAIEKQENENV